MEVNLYRKLRPTTWEQVLGNAGNVKQLQAFATSPKRPHTYLFTGGSGQGKTTLARIFARELGADDLTIKEMNLADSRGIDTMREVIEKLKYVSHGGKPTVYIMDEYHRATADAQSAMLKPFEDTPAHVYFILCTTDPQKVLKTIKTRCTEIKVEAVENRDLFRYLTDTAKAENIGASKDVLKAIMQSADGSVRKALVMLEQVAGIKDEAEQLKAINTPAEDEAGAMELCRALLTRKWGAVAEVLKTLREQKAESESVRYAVLGYMSSVVLNSGKADAAYVMECFSENTYDTKFPGLVLACFQACQGE